MRGGPGLARPSAPPMVPLPRPLHQSCGRGRTRRAAVQDSARSDRLLALHERRLLRHRRDAERSLAPSGGRTRPLALRVYVTPLLLALLARRARSSHSRSCHRTFACCGWTPSRSCGWRFWPRASRPHRWTMRAMRQTTPRRSLAYRRRRRVWRRSEELDECNTRTAGTVRRAVLDEQQQGVGQETALAYGGEKLRHIHARLAKRWAPCATQISIRGVPPTCIVYCVL